MGWDRAVAAARLAVLRLLLWVTPALRHAVVFGFPDDEGNSVETVRALSRRLPVYWLTGDHPDEVQWLLPEGEPRYAVRRVSKNTVRAYLAYVSARYVFFTHGLYGSTRPPPYKTVVNLWHGDGPKRSKKLAIFRSTYVVAGTQLWGSQRPLNFSVDGRGVLVTGNPRIDQLARPPDDETLRRLGINPVRPLVIWMPTFRRTDNRGHRIGAVRNWTDASELSESGSVRDLTKQIAAAAERLGTTLAIKPHPLDADNYQEMGLEVVTGDDLRRERVTLYQLLGRSHGLITDYSSVWTDYLATDRPIGFYCPDLDEYEATRGLNVEHYADLIPGPLLESVSDFEQFLRDCVDEPVASKDRRARSVSLIGAETRLGASDRLLDALGIATPQEPT